MKPQFEQFKLEIEKELKSHLLGSGETPILDIFEIHLQSITEDIHLLNMVDPDVMDNEFYLSMLYQIAYPINISKKSSNDTFKEVVEKLQIDNFVEYIELNTSKYRKQWLNQIILDYRRRINDYFNGNGDADLVNELEKKKETIMNTEDTLVSFMRGILEVDIIAQAVFEPNTRNVPKEMMLIEYLKDNEITIDYNQKGDKLKDLTFKGYNIESAIWSQKSNDAGVLNRFNKIKTNTYETPTILIVEGPKVKEEYLESVRSIHNLQVMNVNQFIQWGK